MISVRQFLQPTNDLILNRLPGKSVAGDGDFNLRLLVVNRGHDFLTARNRLEGMSEPPILRPSVGERLVVRSELQAAAPPDGGLETFEGLVATVADLEQLVQPGDLEDFQNVFSDRTQSQFALRRLDLLVERDQLAQRAFDRYSTLEKSSTTFLR